MLYRRFNKSTPYPRVTVAFVDQSTQLINAPLQLRLAGKLWRTGTRVRLSERFGAGPY